MAEHYIMPGEARRKLKNARALSQTVYVGAPIGFGKSELIRQYLKARNYLEIACRPGSWQREQMEQRLSEAIRKNQGRDTVLVVDDLQFLDSEEGQRQIVSFAAREGIWLLLLGRAAEVKWLSPVLVEKGFMRIGEEDLALGEKEIAAYFSAQRLSVSGQELSEIREWSMGNPKAIQLLVRLLKEQGDGKPLTKELMEQGARIFQDYLLVQISECWNDELTEFFMQLSVVDSFTEEQAELITGNGHALGMLRMAEQTGSFLKKTEGSYQIKRTLLRALRRKRDEFYESAYVRGLYYNAGLYYEMHEQVPEALHMYEKSRSERRIQELLTRNIRRNPYFDFSRELRQYYRAIPEKEIRRSTALMSGMSMLSSHTMEPERSEYWYNALKAYGKERKGSEVRELNMQLLYLELALPHRGSTEFPELLRRLPERLEEEALRLPDFALTGNIPSLLNGTKDLFPLFLKGREEAYELLKAAEPCFGRQGRGALNLILGELLFETGQDSYEVAACLSRAQLQAQSGGSRELEFAVLGVFARLDILHGKEQDAAEKMDGFEKTLSEGGSLLLRKNLEALRLRIALYGGSPEYSGQWMEQAPEETKEFYVPERYRYLTKVRCYLALGEELKALSLLEKLLFYAECYDRAFERTEALLLKAITQYRLGEDFRETLERALLLAEENHFLRLLSLEGAALMPLLESLEAPGTDAAERSGWMAELWKECGMMQNRYPAYLRKNMDNCRALSEQALSVLSYLAKGYSAPRIGEALSMKPETVRYHIKQIYRKLGVRGRSDAVLTARNLGIL